MLLGESLEDYLECIIQLAQKGKVRSVDVANMMHVSKPSVNKAMNNLKDKGLITQETYGDIRLTKAGEDMAIMIFDRHQNVHIFLRDILHIADDIAEQDACRIEHIISEETYQAILNHTEKHK
ncbi:MAG: metal-dependent transcriptional regulator [Breznakia sp.]